MGNGDREPYCRHAKRLPMLQWAESLNYELIGFALSGNCCPVASHKEWYIDTRRRRRGNE